MTRLTFQNMSAGFAFIVAFWLSLHAAAYAGPPYETDDPEPTQYRDYEIYFYTDYHRVGGNVEDTSGTLELNYGALPNTQLSITIPDGNEIEVGLKYRFVAEGAGRPQIAFYPSTTLDGTLFLPLWGQKSYGKWTFFGGGGLQLDRRGGEQSSWREGLAITRDVGSSNIGVEIFRATPEGAKYPGYTDVGVGMISDVGKYHAVLWSLGRALAPNSIHAYAAYEWRLGP